MRKTLVGFMGTLLVGVIASLAVAGAQVPNGGWTTTSSTGATGTAGMGNPSNPNGQQGHFTDSTGNSWLMKWDSVAQQYTLFFKGQEVGTMNFSTTPPPPPFNFTVRDNAGNVFSTGTFTRIP